jgi:hypothetical protein
MPEYAQDDTEISLSLLLEVIDALKGYGSDVIVVGGWAPYFLLQKHGSNDAGAHVGSLDGDLALNFKHIPEDKYETILETLTRLGYVQRKNASGKEIPASFEKTIMKGETPFTMQIDFLAGEYGGSAKSHRHQKVQDMLAHKGRGTDLAFNNFYKEEIQGTFPNGAEVRVTVCFANEIAMFAMKGVAISQRTKAKDYYDLYMLAKHLAGGPTALGQRLSAFRQNKVIVEAADNVRKYFDSPKGLGPTSVADFLGETEPESREIVQRDGFEVLIAVLTGFDNAELRSEAAAPLEESETADGS